MAPMRMVLTGHATEAEARDQAETIIAGGFSAGWVTREQSGTLLGVLAPMVIEGRLEIVWEANGHGQWFTVHGGPSLRVLCAWCGAGMGSKPCEPAQAGATSHGICEECVAKLEGGR